MYRTYLIISCPTVLKFAMLGSNKGFSTIRTDLNSCVYIIMYSIYYNYYIMEDWPSAPHWLATSYTVATPLPPSIQLQHYNKEAAFFQPTTFDCKRFT